MRVAVFCNNARIHADATFSGDPTEIALLDFALRFHSPLAVRERRTIFDNLKKSVRYTVTHTVPEVLSFLAAAGRKG